MAGANVRQGGARLEARGGRHARCGRPGEGARQDGEGRRAALRGNSAPWSGTSEGERPSLPPTSYSAAPAVARVQAGGVTGLWHYLSPRCEGEGGPDGGEGVKNSVVSGERENVRKAEGWVSFVK